MRPNPVCLAWPSWFIGRTRPFVNPFLVGSMGQMNAAPRSLPTLLRLTLSHSGFISKCSRLVQVPPSMHPTVTGGIARRRGPCEDSSLAPSNAVAPLNVGFLTVLHEPSGYLGGYLVVNTWGRPL